MTSIFSAAIIFVFLLYSVTSMGEPLIKIIISPCEYNEKVVSTSGLLGIPNPLEPSKGRLFLTADDYEFNNFEQSIIVNLPSEIALKKELFDNKFVNIEGNYDCSISSHGNFGSGGFKSISRIFLAYKNPNFNTNVFSKGLIKEVQSKNIVEFGKRVISKLNQKKSKQSLYSFLFKNFEEKEIKIERLNWIFDSYLTGINSENYKFCKAYEYKEQEDPDITEGFICYSNNMCDFSEIKNAENLPDWLDKSHELCLEYESENNEIKLSLFQFY